MLFTEFFDGVYWILIKDDNGTLHPCGKLMELVGSFAAVKWFLVIQGQLSLSLSHTHTHTHTPGTQDRAFCQNAWLLLLTWRKIGQYSNGWCVMRHWRHLVDDGNHGLRPLKYYGFKQSNDLRCIECACPHVCRWLDVHMRANENGQP
jgi:hypothetical protein